MLNYNNALFENRVEPKGSLDDFPTPPWATRALCEWLERQGFDTKKMTVREPAANRGHMATVLAEYFKEVVSSDIHDYGVGFPVEDYLLDYSDEKKCDFTITNPPFNLASQFIQKACATSKVGVAIFVRTSFVESQKRYHNIFKSNRPAFNLQFAERVNIFKGTVSKDRPKAMAFCWLIWLKNPKIITTTQDWIPPCRKHLERDGDYS